MQEPVELSSFRLKCNLITNSIFETDSPCSILMGETICHNYKANLPIAGEGGSISYYPIKYTLCDSTPLYYSASMPIGVILGVLALAIILMKTCTITTVKKENK